MKRIIAIFLLASVMTVIAAGCGKAKDTGSGNSGTQVEESVNSPDNSIDSSADNKADSSSASSSESKGDSVFAKDFLSVDKYQDLLKTFKEFGYVYNTKKAGEENVPWTFNYVSLGNETIDGVNTEHFKVTVVEKGETKEFEAWYDDSWSAVKFKNQDGEKTGVDASFSGGTLAMMTQLYCNLLPIKGLILNEDGTVNTEMFEDKGKRSQSESVDFGKGSTEVEIYDLSVKFGDADKVFGISKFDGKKMYVVLETVSKDKQALDGLRITRAVLR